MNYPAAWKPAKTLSPTSAEALHISQETALERLVEAARLSELAREEALRELVYVMQRLHKSGAVDCGD